MADMLASLVPLLGQALLHFVWQGALIGLLTALVLDALRNSRPQARYAVACLALLLCVLTPIATMLLVLAPDIWGPISTTCSPRRARRGYPCRGRAVRVRADCGASCTPTCPRSSRVGGGHLPVVAAHGLGLAWVRRMRNVPQGPAQLAWQSRLDAMAVHFLPRRGVALRLVDNLESPVSAGWWRPVVLLPAGLLTRMPTDLIEALLAHELAHIRRHDYLVNLLQNAIEAVLFYHPVVWWLSHRIRVEREQIADQLAAEVACGPRRLALALVRAVRSPARRARTRSPHGASRQWQSAHVPYPAAPATHPPRPRRLPPPLPAAGRGCGRHRHLYLGAGRRWRTEHHHARDAAPGRQEARRQLRPRTRHRRRDAHVGLDRRHR